MPDWIIVPPPAQRSIPLFLERDDLYAVALPRGYLSICNDDTNVIVVQTASPRKLLEDLKAIIALAESEFGSDWGADQCTTK